MPKTNEMYTLNVFKINTDYIVMIQSGKSKPIFLLNKYIIKY